MHLEHAELALDVQDPGLDRGHGTHREVEHALDRERGRHLDDEGVLTGERRVAAPARRRAHVRRELGLQVLQEQVDPEVRHDPDVSK